MNSAKLVIEDITHSYNWEGEYLTVLNRINMMIEQGQFACIIGPSGCGKSTLFNIITGLENPVRGKVLLDNRVITGQRGHIAYMPQRDLLFPWRNLIDNVVLGAEINGERLEEVREEAYNLLPLFGLDGFERAMPAELSGGMRQRAALLRTVLIDKDIMALDEPFGALDAFTRSEMQSWLLKVWQRLDKTILFITHDIEEALVLADRIFVLTERPGRVLEDVQVDLKRPRDKVSDDFIGLKSHLLKMLYTPEVKERV